MSSAPIDKKTLEHLAELGRIELDKKNEEKLLGDFQKILGHFDELKEVDTENIKPMAGGTIEKNIFREDAESSKFPCLPAGRKVESSKLTEAFPEKENGYLKVPAVFE